MTGGLGGVTEGNAGIPELGGGWRRDLEEVEGGSLRRGLGSHSLSACNVPGPAGAEAEVYVTYLS